MEGEIYVFLRTDICIHANKRTYGETFAAENNIKAVVYPFITGVENAYVKVGGSFLPMSGVKAYDNEDGDLTSSITVTGSVDTSKTGTYTLTYTVIDSDRNTTTVNRVVTVEKVMISISRTLVKGMNGPEVLAVQHRLVELGYLTATPDGIYGKITEAAVIMFQAANGLETPDGMVGNWTVGKLNSDSVVRFSSFSKGSTGNQVKVMQKYLVKLGYLKATPDGIFGNMSYEALKAFQTRNGLSQTGIADQTTLAKLYHEDAIKAKTVLTISRTLARGMSGAEVLAVQQNLAELGYLAVTPDGIYGKMTEAAVIMFQAANGLETPDGKVGNWTVGKLNSDTAVRFSSFSKGSTGNAVKVMQKYLVKLGYLTATPDGVFGNMSYSALKEFQAKNGLTQTGVADQATLAKLYHADAIRK